MKLNEISVYYVVNKLGILDMNLCFCGTTLLPDICKFAMKYLLNIYESLRCLHIYKYLQVHYKVTTKFLWYIHIYGITMSLCRYYNLYNIFQSLLMQRQHHQRTGLEMFCILSPWYYIICNSIGDNSASASMCILSPGLPSPSHLQPYLHCPRVGPGWVEAFSAGPVTSSLTYPPYVTLIPSWSW